MNPARSLEQWADSARQGGALRRGVPERVGAARHSEFSPRGETGLRQGAYLALVHAPDTPPKVAIGGSPVSQLPASRRRAARAGVEAGRRFRCSALDHLRRGNVRGPRAGIQLHAVARKRRENSGPKRPDGRTTPHVEVRRDPSREVLAVIGAAACIQSARPCSFPPPHLWGRKGTWSGARARASGHRARGRRSFLPGGRRCVLPDWRGRLPHGWPRRFSPQRMRF